MLRLETTLFAVLLLGSAGCQRFDSARAPACVEMQLRNTVVIRESGDRVFGRRHTSMKAAALVNDRARTRLPGPSTQEIQALRAHQRVDLIWHGRGLANHLSQARVSPGAEVAHHAREAMQIELRGDR